MARKKKHEEHENHERWLISYADFITLLFAFFVVMYSVSSVNEGKYRVLSDALVAAFRSSARSLEPIQVGGLSRSKQQAGAVPVEVKLPVENKTPRQKKSGSDKGKGQGESESESESGSGSESESGRERAQMLGQVADKIEQAMADLIKQDLISVRRDKLWVEVEIQSNILYSLGGATLQPKALPVLRELGRILRDFPNPIRVEGFTDDLPINTMVFPSNWELSAARSASVVHLFTNAGVDPRRLAAIGFGQYRPIADNDTPEGRSKNRRVVIVILESAAAERLFNDSYDAVAEIDDGMLPVAPMGEPVFDMPAQTPEPLPAQ